MQESFDGVMVEYPESFKAMDLVAEHRLRVLHASEAWVARPTTARSPIAAEIGAKIDQILEVRHS